MRREGGISSIWKVVLAYLEVIHFGLAWKVGNGHSFRIRHDLWPGSSHNHVLSMELVESLEQKNFQFLFQVGDEGTSSIISQGCKSGILLGLDVDHCREWGIYVLALQRAHIHLNESEDSLVWDKSPDGKYIPKAGYITICADMEVQEIKWWRKGIWKI